MGFRVGESVVEFLDVISDPDNNRAQGAPSDSHEFGDGAPKNLRDQPGDWCVKVTSVAVLVTNPGSR